MATKNVTNIVNVTSATTPKVNSGLEPSAEALDPSYYQMPGGAQTIDITEQLTGNAARAVDYIVRTSRLDGVQKGDTPGGEASYAGMIENLSKAVWFLQREMVRLSNEEAGA